jgi:hypothetical protein
MTSPPIRRNFSLNFPGNNLMFDQPLFSASPQTALFMSRNVPLGNDFTFTQCTHLTVSLHFLPSQFFANSAMSSFLPSLMRPSRSYTLTLGIPARRDLFRERGKWTNLGRFVNLLRSYYVVRFPALLFHLTQLNKKLYLSF